MKRIFNLLKMLLSGVVPAVAGGIIVCGIWRAAINMMSIAYESGWSVVLSFVLAVLELILVVLILYKLGNIQHNSKKWIAHKKAEAAQNNNSSSSDCETSGEATDTSSDTKSKSRRKKAQ